MMKFQKGQRLCRYLAFLLHSSFKKPTGGEKKYPTVIQLPITKRCNSRCVMCDIWKMPKGNELTSEEFGRILKDSIFKEVRAIGVNGGEPSMLPDLLEYIDHMLALPKIKNINIISNGFMTDPLLNKLETIKNKCSLQGIKFHVSFSLDGVGEVHDKQRGVTDAFLKTTKRSTSSQMTGQGIATALTLLALLQESTSNILCNSTDMRKQKNTQSNTASV